MLIIKTHFHYLPKYLQLEISVASIAMGLNMEQNLYH